MMAHMKYRTEWNLGLLYKSEKDPQIEKDMRAIEKACNDFQKKYKGKNFTATAKRLLAALNDYEKLLRITTPKPWWYFTLLTDMNSDNTHAAAMKVKMEQRLNNASNKTVFFMLAIGAIPEHKKKAYLKNQLLARYTHLLETEFDRAKHNLSEKEEQMLTLLTQTSFTMWIDRHQQLIAQQMLTHKGKKIPLTAALYLIPDLPKNERHSLHKQATEALKRIAPSAEGELNAIFNYRKTVDELKGYRYPFSESILNKENDEQEVFDLLDVVKKNFPVSKRFFALHAKLLGEKKVAYPDYRAKIGTIKSRYPFDKAVKIVHETLTEIDPEYGNILNRYLERGQIDVAPRKGKRGGGYCWGIGNLPVYILLNHLETIDSVETLAHEMGHGIHGEMDDHLPYHYQDHSIAVAEVASTFFEQAAGETLMQSLSDEERLIFLHSKISGDIHTIFAQIIGFNFELELHETARKEGQLTKERMAQLMQNHLKSYMGDAVDVTEDDGYRYTSWLHIRLIFYLYSYAYGQLVSRALYERWKADHSFAAKVKEFLNAGKSKYPKDIFKDIGITVDKKFFETGIKGIARDIDELEKLAKKLKKI